MRAEAALRSVQVTSLHRRRQAWNAFQHGLIYLVLGVAGFGFIAPFLWMILTALKTTPQLFVWPPVIIPYPLQ